MPELVDEFDGPVSDEEAANAGPARSGAATPVTPLSFSEVLRLRPVRRLWIAQIVSVFGDFLAVFAIIAVVTFRLHGTATQVAMVLVSFMLPMAIVSPLAGVFVDRWHLKRTMIASDLIRGVLVLALVFVHNLYAIYAILFAMSMVSAFFVPAQSVAVRTLVPMAGLMAVNGLMSQAQQGSLIVAPSVAGELVELAGANSCFLYDSFSFFFSAALVMTLTIERQAVVTESRAVLESMRQGFGFIFRHSTISFVIVSMTAGMFAMRCFGALLSIYVRDVLHSTSAGVRCAEHADRRWHDRGDAVADAVCAARPAAEPGGVRFGRNGHRGIDHGRVRQDGIDGGGNARIGPVRVRDFHHGDDADPARDAA